MPNVASLYLNRLSASDRHELIEKLHLSQQGNCFICQQPIDLSVHAQSVDIDHVEPLKIGGVDGPANFALTHASCNRSKQASDLRVARVLATFEQIRALAGISGRGPDLSDVLTHFGGAKHDLGFSVDGDIVKYSFAELGDNSVRNVDLHTDKLSGLRYFFATLPIAYMHHDDRINPRSIGGSLSGLLEEFHRGRPQLHVALAWLASSTGPGTVKVFDGQHKTTAQVLLGVGALPVRVFVEPNPDLLLTTNTNAGTALRQVAFDKSVQRRLGRSLFSDRVERYRAERGLDEADESFSERDLVTHFKGESREIRRYALDSVRAAITHHTDNKLLPYIEFGGKSTEKPLSYSTIEKTFLSFFVYPDVLDTPLNHRAEEGLNPRELEVSQVVALMNIVAEELLVGKFDLELGAARIEYKVQRGEDLPDHHVRAFRMMKEEILSAWLRYVRQIVQTYFNMMGQPVDEARLFQHPFPAPLWDRLRSYVVNLSKLPAWVNKDLSASVFGGKQSADFWREIFQTGKAPSGQQVLAAPINLMDMIADQT